MSSNIGHAIRNPEINFTSSKIEHIPVEILTGIPGTIFPIPTLLLRRMHELQYLDALHDEVRPHRKPCLLTKGSNLVIIATISII